MGDLLRRFWVPVLLEEEVPAPDSVPVAIRIMGEDLLAFRDTDGRVGLIAAYCAHRHAHLFWGRNEEGGIRCTYHGWKYDVSGRCVDMPNEPADSVFKDKIRITAYPTRDAGGLVWAYMGPPELMPASLPHFEFMDLPESHVHHTKRLQLSNWAQAVEGGIDSSHISFLHRNLDSLRAAEQGGRRGPGAGPVSGQVAADGFSRQQFLAAADRSPKFYLQDADFGYWVGARRSAGADAFYWRLTPMLLPFYTIIPGSGAGRGGHAWVPIDDEHCWAFSFAWNAEAPMHVDGGGGIHAAVDRNVSMWELGLSNAYLPVRNRWNNYQISREDQRTLSYTGIKGIGEQDMSIQESMGSIVPREKEHLGTTDLAITQFRRVLLKMVRAFMESGLEPEVAHRPVVYDVVSCAVVLPRDAHWIEGTREFVRPRVAATSAP